MGKPISLSCPVSEQLQHSGHTSIYLGQSRSLDQLFHMDPGMLLFWGPAINLGRPASFPQLQVLAMTAPILTGTLPAKWGEAGPFPFLPLSKFKRPSLTKWQQGGTRGLKRWPGGLKGAFGLEGVPISWGWWINTAGGSHQSHRPSQVDGGTTGRWGCTYARVEFNPAINIQFPTWLSFDRAKWAFGN
ncbi:hypothetical protein WJX79_004595 [Trebouxia sp. C0005]